jgi:hypothetical protein
MGSKHTPGPWRIHPFSEKHAFSILGDFNGRSNVIVGDVGKYIKKGDAAFKIAEANARLIAAAPKLLKAAKEAERYLRFNKGNGNPAYELLISAIVESEENKNGPY